MPRVTEQRLAQIKRWIDTVEPNRDVAHRFNADDVPAIRRLYSDPPDKNGIERERAMTRALRILVQLIPEEERISLISEASLSPLKSMRRAAAVSAAGLPASQATAIFARLIEDPDASVQRATARRMPVQVRKSIRPFLQHAVERANKGYSHALLTRILADTPTDDK